MRVRNNETEREREKESLIQRANKGGEREREIYR